MSSITNINPYEYLKVDCLSDIDPVPAQFSWSITDSREESVTILTSELPSGLWCYGYSVYWLNGRHSHTAPDPRLGVFKTQRNAKLYALGFMTLYTKYFSEPTQVALTKAIGEISQDSLF